jgi:hypothetical protein
MKKLLFAICTFASFTVMNITAQNNVGIGTTSPHASAVLDLTASDKGLLIPRVNLVALNNGAAPISSPATGLLVYNQGGSVAVGFYYWDGDEWILVGSGGSVAGCTPLDEAYDCNGSGAGRVITADAGSVEIVSTNEFKPLFGYQLGCQYICNKCRTY